MEYHVNSGDAPLLKQPPWKIAFSFADEDHKYIEKLKAKDVILPSTSPWVSPLMMVQKKNEFAHICVGYHKLNLVTKNDTFPIPRT